MNKLLWILALACSCYSLQLAANPKTLQWQQIDSQANQPPSFTQGLELNNKHWYISSGGYGRSYIAKLSKDGHESKHYKLPPKWFAEGLTLFENKLYLLSWKQQKGIIFDPQSLKPKQTFRYQGEGWGLSHLDKKLVMSNGSNQLAFYQPEGFKLLHKITVHSPGSDRVWDKLNELEVFGGLIWANIWQQNQVIGIDPGNGQVKYILDFNALVPEPFRNHPNNVLNGLAWDKDRNGLWVSGKFWPQRFLIRLPHLD